MTTKMPTARNRNAFSWAFCLCAAICLILLTFKTPWARTLIIEGLEEPPLKWLDYDTPRGIDVDIMTEVLRELDIRDFTFRFVDSGKRLLHNAQMGASDIILTLSQNDERTEYLEYPQEAHLLLDWRFAIRVADVNHIRFSDFEDLAPYRIGAAAGYSYTRSFWESGLDIETVARNDLLIRCCWKIDWMLSRSITSAQFSKPSSPENANSWRFSIRRYVGPPITIRLPAHQTIRRKQSS